MMFPCRQKLHFFGVGLGVCLCVLVSVAHADVLREDASAVRVQVRSRYVDQGIQRVPGAPVGEVGGRFVWERLAFDWEWITGLGESYDESLIGGAYIFDGRDMMLAPVVLQAGARRRGYPGVIERQSRWEAWARVDWFLARHLALQIDAYQGVSRNRTGFGTIGLLFPLPLDLQQGSILTPSITLGLDMGDISGRRSVKEHHIEYGVMYFLPLGHSVSCMVELRHSDGVGGRDTGTRPGTRTWGTLGLVFSF